MSERGFLGAHGEHLHQPHGYLPDTAGSARQAADRSERPPTEAPLPWGAMP